MFDVKFILTMNYITQWVFKTAVGFHNCVQYSRDFVVGRCRLIDLVYIDFFLMLHFTFLNFNIVRLRNKKFCRKR